MGGFLDIQQRVKSFFVNYEIYLMPFLKFLAMMAVLLMMNWHLGYRLLQMRWILVILVSLVCSLLPWSGITVVTGIYLLGHVSALTWEGAAMLATLFLVALLLHYLLLPGGSFLIVLVPMAFYLKIPYIIPLLAGVFGSGLSFVPIGLGTAVYYLMAVLERNALYLLDPSHKIQERFMQILQSYISSRAMVLSIAALCLAALAVFAIRRLSVDYAPYIAVGVGGILMLVVYLVGGFLLETAVSPAVVLFGCLVSVLLAEGITFWRWTVDYSRPEFLEYEDDEYVYYVKAVPKMVVERSDRQVREINSRRVKTAREDGHGEEAEAERSARRRVRREDPEEERASRRRIQREPEEEDNIRPRVRRRPAEEGSETGRIRRESADGQSVRRPERSAHDN